MSTTLVWIIVAIVWVLGAFIAYPIIDKHIADDDAPKWQKIWFSAVWPCTAILAGISWLHNNIG